MDIRSVPPYTSVQALPGTCEPLADAGVPHQIKPHNPDPYVCTTPPHQSIPLHMLVMPCSPHRSCQHEPLHQDEQEKVEQGEYRCRLNLQHKRGNNDAGAGRRRKEGGSAAALPPSQPLTWASRDKCGQNTHPPPPLPPWFHTLDSGVSGVFPITASTTAEFTLTWGSILPPFFALRAL